MMKEKFSFQNSKHLEFVYGAYPKDKILQGTGMRRHNLDAE
jgi:hypothetical protein